MSFARAVARALHDDHLATMGALEKLEGLLTQHRRGGPPDAAAAGPKAALTGLIGVIGAEVGSHFRFEEEELFPRLEEAGDGMIGHILSQEHQLILPLGERMAALATAARDQGFTPETWEEFRGLAPELIERMVFHIQKEEMALLPRVDHLLGPEDDMRLATAYADRS